MKLRRVFILLVIILISFLFSGCSVSDNEDNINYAMELLDKYDLIKFKDKFPYELSGGMKQRVVCI